MKIIYFSNSEVPAKAANSVHVMHMCAALAGLGHDVELYTKRSASTQHPSKCDVFAHYGVPENFLVTPVWFPRFRGKTFVYAIAGLLHLVKAKPDLVYGRSLLGCALAALFGYPTALEFHNDCNSAFEKKVFRLLVSRKCFLGLVVISEALKRHVATQYAYHNVLVAHDAAPKVIGVADPVTLQSSENYELNVGYVGQLYQGKGMEIISQLARRCTSYGFHIVGGSDTDVAHWSHSLHGVPNVFFYGHQPHRHVSSFLGQFDVVVAPYAQTVHAHNSERDISRWMSPLKLFEYMSAKQAIVASDLPVIREVLRHNENALLCPPDALDKWVDALNTLAHDEALRQRLGACAYADFSNAYTWERRAQRITDFVSTQQRPA